MTLEEVIEKAVTDWVHVQGSNVYYCKNRSEAIALRIREWMKKEGYEKACTCEPIRGTYTDINCPKHGKEANHGGVE